MESKTVWNVPVFLDGDTSPRLTSLTALLSSYAVMQIKSFFEGGILNRLTGNPPSITVNGYENLRSVSRSDLFSKY